MRRSTNGGMRIVPMERILELVPDDAKRVGLVGAAVSDHPKIVDIVRTLAERGCEVGLSSLRPDRLNDDVRRRAQARRLPHAHHRDGRRERAHARAARAQGARASPRSRRRARARARDEAPQALLDDRPARRDRRRHRRVRVASRRELSRRIPVVARHRAVLREAQHAARRRSRSPASTWCARASSACSAGCAAEPTFARRAPGGPGSNTCSRRGASAEGRAVLDAVHAGGNFAAYPRAFERARPARAQGREDGTCRSPSATC